MQYEYLLGCRYWAKYCEINEGDQGIQQRDGDGDGDHDNDLDHDAEARVKAEYLRKFMYLPYLYSLQKVLLPSWFRKTVKTVYRFLDGYGRTW